MRKFYIMFSFVMCAVAILSAQNFYFEVGAGIGTASTEYGIGYKDSSLNTNWDGETWSEFESMHGIPLTKSGQGLDLGAKIGYGELFGLPLYLVGDLSWTRGNTWTISQESGYSDDSYSELLRTNAETKINHLFFGPGLVFYPTNNFQVAASVGMVNTTVALKLSLEERFHEVGYAPERYRFSFSYKDSGVGLGFNLSAAVDIGDSSGFLLGGKYSYYNNDVELNIEGLKTNFDVSASYVGLFLNYRFRG